MVSFRVLVPRRVAVGRRGKGPVVRSKPGFGAWPEMAKVSGAAAWQVSLPLPRLFFRIIVPGARDRYRDFGLASTEGASAGASVSPWFPDLLRDSGG